MMGKKLVAYFSASGITKKLAEKIAEAIDADIFEIVPENPYTEADLKWTNPLARCNKEKIGKKDVPVKGKVENMSEYGAIYLGFPIWYWGAPNVINTFVKSYDLNGKKIVLFATSGGSDIGKTADKLRPYLGDGAQIVDAKVLNGEQSPEQLGEWLKDLDV